MVKDMKKLEELKKKALKAEKVYEDLAVEYYRTHYNTDKEYKALFDADEAYHSVFDEYVLTAMKIYYEDKRKAEKLMGDL